MAKKSEYEIRREGRGRYRLYLDGRRTSYCGDTYEQALKMKQHLELQYEGGE